MALISKPPFSELGETQRWDAECFAPNLRALDTKFAKYSLLTKLASVTHPAEIARVYCDTEQGVPFLRAQNIRPLLPDMTDVAQIKPEVASVITVNRLETNDVLVTRSGAYSGVATVYLGASGKCYTSGEGIIVRSLGDIDGAYLVAFFNTLPGSALCRRAIYGSGQPHIGPKYLERIRVPRIGKVEAKAAQLIREAHNQIEATRSAYAEAESELLERLGWAELEKQPRELCFSINFSNLSTAARNDAERFHPNVVRVRHFLTKQKAEDIATVCDFVKHGLQPPYLDNGNVGIVSQRQFTGSGLDLDSLENFTNDEFCKENPDFRIQKNDVLTYCVSAGEYLAGC